MTGFTPDAPVLHEIKNHSEELTKAEAGVAACAAKRNNRWDPKFHIASNGGWINDPNGLCQFQGRYHLFFQLNPYGFGWDNMHWGHAVSRDLVHWTHLPVFLEPQPELHTDERIVGGAFSGSAVTVDEHDNPVAGNEANAIRLYLTRHLETRGDESSVTEYQTTCLCEDGVHVRVE